MSEFHSFVVHFPIALLLIAPVFVLLGALQPDTRGRTLLFAALVLMCLGSAGAFAGRFSGAAAARSAPQTADARLVLEHHGEMADITSIVFGVLTVAFAATLWAIAYRRLGQREVLQRVVPLVFLVLYGAGILLLLDTVRLGGRLTHEYSVNAKGPARSRLAATFPKPDHDKEKGKLRSQKSN